MQTVTSADGTEIAYETHGDGPPLVCLHGDATHEYWDPIVPRFAAEYTVVTPDRRARGDSGDHEYVYSLEREVEDVLAVLDSIEGAPVLFGHSFGGLLAIEAARQTAVAGLIAYEPAILVGEYRERAALADRMAAHVEAGDPETAMKLHVAEVLHDGESEGLDAWLEAWEAWPEYVDFAETTLRMNYEIERYELDEEIDVGAPALVLSGTEGPQHLRDSARAVDEALVDGEFVEFDGVSHVGPVEAPERVSEAVGEYLARVEDPRRRI